MSNPISGVLNRFIGQDNVMVIHRPILELCENDHAVALFVEQCAYWSGKKASGWFYKSDDDWRQEIGLTDYKMRSIKRLIKDKKLPFISHELRKAEGSPTSHYRFDAEKLCEVLQIHLYETIQNQPYETIQIINRDHNREDDQGAAPRYEDAEPEPQTIEEADVLFSKCVRLYEVITKMPPNEMIGDEMVTASQIYGMEKMRRALLTAVEAKARIPWPYALKVLENDFRQAVGVSPKELQERKAAALAIQEENLRASDDIREWTQEEIEAAQAALKKALRRESDD